MERNCRAILFKGSVERGSNESWPDCLLLNMATASSRSPKGISEAVLEFARLVHGHAPVRDRLAVEALLLVQLMGRACATALHLPPLLDAFLENVSVRRTVMTANSVPRGTCTSTLAWPFCRPPRTLQSR